MMNACFWLVQKYLNLLSVRLECFVWKEARLANFRCPYCGDSKKDKTKARGYVYSKGGKFFYYCHNCNHSVSFATFLREQDGQLYAEYKLESMKEDGGANIQSVSSSKPIGKQRLHLDNLSSDEVFPILSLPTVHTARRYLKRRKVEKKNLQEVFYTPNLKELVAKVTTKKKFGGNSSRIVLPLVNREGHVLKFMCRSYQNTDTPRYYGISVDDVDETEVCAFGLSSIDVSQPIYVLEGAMDSLFLPNAIGVSGTGSMFKVLESLPKSKVIVVLDNEPRNKEVLRVYARVIENDYAICLWSSDRLKYGKDVNEMVMNGLIPKDVKNIIDKSTVSGKIKAKLEFSQWREI